MKRVCVIGGGAAGLMAAYAAAKNGNDVWLFEKNEKLGKKIYITGKGRCNFTNDTSPEEFLQNVIRGKKFMMGALYTFPPERVMQFFEENGMAIKTERGNRVFPASDHASDVTKTLERVCKREGVQILLNTKVCDIIMPDEIPTSSEVVNGTTSDEIPSSRIIIKTEDSEHFFDEIIIATGGLSYPTTGSTGDGYRFAQSFGHSIVPLKCGLCGLNLHGDWYKPLQGLALKNVAMKAQLNGKTLYEDFGEMLFTHFGVSGPLVLSLSSYINRVELDKLFVGLDLKPALDEQTLDKRLLRDFEKYKNKQIANALIELLPQKLILPLLDFAKISPSKNVNVITKEERLRLIKTLKNMPISVRSLRGFEEAIITSGGIELSQVNPKTMESKKYKHVRFCGEVLDVDALTGGFNLQIAFSTGYVAGNSIDPS